MKRKRGRPIDKHNIDPKFLKNWIKNDRSRWAIIKCQALVSLAEGASVVEICRVMGVTRESLRIWRKVYRAEGPDGFVSHKRTGRKTKMTPEIKRLLKEMLAKSPQVSSLGGDRWTGKLVQEYLESRQDLKVSLRTALYWIKKIKKQI